MPFEMLIASNASGLIEASMLETFNDI